MREMIDKLCDDYIEHNFQEPNRLKCNYEMSIRVKSSPDLYFQSMFNENKHLLAIVNGLLLEVDNEIAPGIIVVDRV